MTNKKMYILRYLVQAVKQFGVPLGNYIKQGRVEEKPAHPDVKDEKNPDINCKY